MVIYYIVVTTKKESGLTYYLSYFSSDRKSQTACPLFDEGSLLGKGQFIKLLTKHVTFSGNDHCSTPTLLEIDANLSR